MCEDVNMDNSVSRIPLRLIVDGKGETKGELIRFLAPRTVERVLSMLPVEGRAALLKEGVYFEKSLSIGTEKAVSVVEARSLAYWPMASSICIFYGKTQTYSPVNIIGRVTGDLDLFKGLNSGTRIKIEKV